MLIINSHTKSARKDNLILYVDETESDEYFVVDGVLFSDPSVMEIAYKQFKEQA